MKVGIGIAYEPLEVMPELAEQADRLGIHGVWMGEAAHEGFLSLAAVAARTKHATLGTNVVIAFARSPTITAHAAWDLQRMSKGRFILGMGSEVKGHMEHRFSVPWEPPVPKMREVVLALRAIWDCWQSGGKLDFEGKHYHFSLMPQYFSPGPMQYPPPPIYLGATNRGMCRLVGEVADGILLNPVNTARYLREMVLPWIAEGAAGAGRSPQQVTVAANVLLATGRNKAELEKEREAIRRWVSFFCSPRSYAPVLALHGWQEVGERLHQKSLEGDLEGMARLCPDDMLHEFALIGEYDAIPELVKRRFGGLVHQIMPLPLALRPHNRDFWKLLVEKLE